MMIAAKNGSLIGAPTSLTYEQLHECPIDGLTFADFSEVSDETYDNTSLDVRFEFGEWVQ